MGTPAVQNLTCYRGVAWALRFTVKDAGGAIVTVAGWHTTFVMRRSPTSPDPATLTVNGAIVDDGSGGQIDVLVTKTQSLAIAPGSYVYSLERVDSGGEEVLTLGALTVVADVVHAP